jgi:hypothetical protein
MQADDGRNVSSPPSTHSAFLAELDYKASDLKLTFAVGQREDGRGWNLSYIQAGPSVF